MTKVQDTEIPNFAPWRLQCFRHKEELLADWPEAQRPDDFWLRKDVLAFLFDYPQGMETEAVLLNNVRTNQRILLTAQTFTFNAAGQVKEAAKGETSRLNFRRMLLAPISFKVLCLGQFLTSGSFSQDGLSQLSAAEAAELLPAVAEMLMGRCGGYAAYLVKDLYGPQHPATQQLVRNNHHLLPVDPTMTLTLPQNWESTEDYLADLTSKYRVRYRRARTKLAGLTRRLLTPQEVLDYQARLYQLYQQVSKDADFNATSLRPDYFPWLAKLRAPHHTFSEAMFGSGNNVSLAETLEKEEGTPRLHGYFDAAGELVGFTSAIPNGSVYHAHFLGLAEVYKHSHHLYHNMLFDLLEDAISGGFRTLDYGRTALEIKSSIGATATDFAVLLRARNRWLNYLIPHFVPAVYSATPWTARNPFRA